MKLDKSALISIWMLLVFSWFKKRFRELNKLHSLESSDANFVYDYRWKYTQLHNKRKYFHILPKIFLGSSDNTLFLCKHLRYTHVQHPAYIDQIYAIGFEHLWTKLQISQLAKSFSNVKYPMKEKISKRTCTVTIIL